MTKKTITVATVIVSVCAVAAVAAVISQSFADDTPAESRYVPEYTASGELILPKNNIWREWVFVGAPLTPEALNSGKANFPEYHNVYIQPWAYAIYKKTHVFPEETIMFKELQLILPPAENPDGSRTEPSGYPRRHDGSLVDYSGSDFHSRV